LLLLRDSARIWHRAARRARSFSSTGRPVADYAGTRAAPRANTDPRANRARRIHPPAGPVLGSPAQTHFTITDPDSDPLDVRVSYSLDEG